MGSTMAILIVVLISSLLLGCSGEFGLGEPEVKEISYEWGEITKSTSEIITKIKVYNPNPVPLPLKDVRTEVYLNSIKIGEGSSLNAEIRPSSESTIVLSTKLENSKIPEWWVSHIKNGEKSTMEVTGYLIFDLKITEFKFPFRLSNSIETDMLSGLISSVPEKIDAGPITLTVKSVKSHWGNVDEDYTEIITAATIRNDNMIPVTLTKFSYLVEMNGIRVGEGSDNLKTVIQPKSEKTITFVTRIENSKLNAWWISHVTNGERTKVRTVFQPQIEVGGVKFWFNMIYTEYEFTTNLLGEIEQS